MRLTCCVGGGASGHCLPAPCLPSPHHCPSSMMKEGESGEGKEEGRAGRGSLARLCRRGPRGASWRREFSWPAAAGGGGPSAQETMLSCGHRQPASMLAPHCLHRTCPMTCNWITESGTRNCICIQMHSGVHLQMLHTCCATCEQLHSGVYLHRLYASCATCVQMHSGVHCKCIMP